MGGDSEAVQVMPCKKHGLAISCLSELSVSSITLKACSKTIYLWLRFLVTNESSLSAWKTAKRLPEDKSSLIRGSFVFLCSKDREVFWGHLLLNDIETIVLLYNRKVLSGAFFFFFTIVWTFADLIIFSLIAEFSYSFKKVEQGRSLC